MLVAPFQHTLSTLCLVLSQTSLIDYSALVAEVQSDTWGNWFVLCVIPALLEESVE